MKALTLKEIFKAVEKNNQVLTLTGESIKNIRVYIDDELIYEGHSYRKFVDKVNDVYFETFATLLVNPMFYSNKTSVYDWDNREYKVEFFVY